MKYSKAFAAFFLGATCVYLVGCGESVPENSKPANGANARVEGSAEDRIKKIEADPILTADEKAKRIAVVKERNHIQ